jgi:membrane associated rhomboid family serine protease
VNELPTAWVEIARAVDRKKCQELALVLQAVGLPHATTQHLDFWVVLVPQPGAERAREELVRYERENRGWPPREAPVRTNSDGVFLAMLYSALLVVGFLAAHRELFGVDWDARGSARAARISAGELWLSVTALTLHVDLVHLAGNLVFGVLFGLLLSWSIGSGLTALCFVATGALGNIVNAFLQPATHVSVGASTAVFGVLGAQAAYEFMRRGDGRPPWRRRIPLIAGIVLLGLLGLGGASHDPSDIAEESRKLDQILQKTDVIAHFTGFGAGLLFGGLLGWRRKLPRIREGTEVLLGAGALCIVALCWALALRHG